MQTLTEQRCRCSYFLFLILIHHTTTTTTSYKIQKLLRESSGAENILVDLRESPLATLRSFPPTEMMMLDRGARIESIVQSLERFAEASQSILEDHLRSRSTPVKWLSIWITNQIVIFNASHTLMEELAGYEEVIRITKDRTIQLSPIQFSPLSEREVAAAKAAPVPQWGVQRVAAEEALHLLTSASAGAPPAEVRIATIDTGVRGSHEALRDNFLGTWGWFDPHELTTFPIDTNGHGTHTTGTICGRTGGIGVQPGAKWMSCRGCLTSGCAISALLLCGQYVLCPTLPNGSGRNCSVAPHVVSNSWGGGQGEDWFDVVIQAWTAAGIIPIFSAGNEGPGCGTVSSPGDRENVISVASTNSDDSLSYFSSRGPEVGGRMKPDVAAPGALIISSYHLGDASYAIASGTSMACPHVAGLASILLSHNPSLGFAKVKDYLSAGADQDKLLKDEEQCGNLSQEIFPNHFFGSGRVNGVKAATLMVFDDTLKSTTSSSTTTTTTTSAPTPPVTVGSGASHPYTNAYPILFLAAALFVFQNEE